MTFIRIIKIVVVRLMIFYFRFDITLEFMFYPAFTTGRGIVYLKKRLAEIKELPA